MCIVSLALTDTGRLFGHGAGTSYAAPRVARAAADILGAYPDASANLVRALLGLSASVPAPVVAAFNTNALRVAGHGVPVALRATASDSRRVVLMGEFAMKTDTVAIHPLPIPAAFRSGRAARTIRVALAFDPPVRRTRREYLAAEMSFELLRASSRDDVVSWYRKQDPNQPLPLPGDRRRLSLHPGSTASGNATLQVRQARAA